MFGSKHVVYRHWMILATILWSMCCLLLGGTAALWITPEKTIAENRSDVAGTTEQISTKGDSAGLPLVPVETSSSLETATDRSGAAKESEPSAQEAGTSEQMQEPLRMENLSALFFRYPTGWTLRGKEPRILIYHTHTTEAYLQTPDQTYRESSKWRTTDTSKNVVAVGERLKNTLEQDYGFCVLHDTTDHEPPKLATAYERSEQTMLAYAEKYPSIQLFIDLHRDAYGGDITEPKDYVTVNGEQCARMMFVVGKGEAYEDKPYYESNLSLAEQIMKHVNDNNPSFMRPIRIKKGRYNQHIAAHCLLIEVGHNANTLEQALASMPYLAEGIAYAIADTQLKVSSWLPKQSETVVQIQRDSVK